MCYNQTVESEVIIDNFERHFGDGAGKLLPMWVSDFDFACPPE
ncbi:aminotransferase, partial [Salmonella enterica subsp. enterica serovar Typhi]|nr:aminotransferase [Salmonella enterica subsp. enterica serovar Typhi]